MASRHARGAGAALPDEWSGRTIGFDSRIHAVQGDSHYGPDRKLGEVAANLDDISETIDEVKDAVRDRGTSSAAALDDLQEGMKKPPT
jgi:hypothetical protein